MSWFNNDYSKEKEQNAKRREEDIELQSIENDNLALRTRLFDEFKNTATPKYPYKTRIGTGIIKSSDHFNPNYFHKHIQRKNYSVSFVELKDYLLRQREDIQKEKHTFRYRLVDMGNANEYYLLEERIDEFLELIKP